MSYEAVRNYHYDREPPPSYLERVAEVFGVRLEYLIRDQGEMLAELESRELLQELAFDAAARLLPLAEDRQLVMHSFYGAMRRIIWSIEETPTEDEVRRLGALLADLVGEPRRRLASFGAYDVRMVTDHYVAMIHALMLLIPSWARAESIETVIAKLEGENAETT